MKITPPPFFIFSEERQQQKHVLSGWLIGLLIYFSCEVQLPVLLSQSLFCLQFQVLERRKFPRQVSFIPFPRVLNIDQQWYALMYSIHHAIQINDYYEENV